MPNISVSLSDEDWEQLKGPNRSATLRRILKEHREHKCPKAKPCDLEHVEGGEYLYLQRTRKGRKGEPKWVVEENSEKGWKTAPARS